MDKIIQKFIDKFGHDCRWEVYRLLKLGKTEEEIDEIFSGERK